MSKHRYLIIQTIVLLSLFLNSCVDDDSFFQEENMTLVYRIIESDTFKLAASILGPHYDPDQDNNTELIIGTAGEAANDIIFADGFDE